MENQDFRSTIRPERKRPGKMNDIPRPVVFVMLTKQKSHYSVILTRHSVTTFPCISNTSLSRLFLISFQLAPGYDLPGAIVFVGSTFLRVSTSASPTRVFQIPKAVSPVHGGARGAGGPYSKLCRGRLAGEYVHS